jgi:hypothetical protein
MVSSGMLRRVALVRTDVSEETSASFIRVTRISELETTLKNGVFWVVTPCGSCKNRRFGGTWRHQVTKYWYFLVFLRSVRRLLVTTSVVSSSLILVTLMKKPQSSSETSVLTKATRRNNPEDTILHSHRRDLHQHLWTETHPCKISGLHGGNYEECHCGI